MDESWRMRMGTPSLAGRRRASDDMTSWTKSAESGRRSSSLRESDAGAMDAADFNDVFGGPPRSVLSRKLSCDFASYDYFYHEIFRWPEEEAERSGRSGRRLPEFRIPSSHPAEEKSGFYNDIFRSSSYCRNADDDQKEKKPSSSSRMWRSLSKSNWTSKSKSKSKSNSSSVLCYEEISPVPIQPRIREEDEDVALASVASKLRPINVPCRWNSSSAIGGIQNNQTCTIDHYEHPYFSRQFPSPEADIPHSTTVGISVDDIGELEPPTSANSMFCHDSEASNVKFQFNASYEQHRGKEEDEYEDEDEEDDIFSSYVIEINSGRREDVSNEAADIDEAIAWAKGKFQGCNSSSEELNVRQHGSSFQFGEERSLIPLMMEVPENVSERYPMVPLYMGEGIPDPAMQKEDGSSGEHLGIWELDERVNSWAAGKDTNIRLLLSSLHHILWPSIGWNAISQSNMLEFSQVKKAYQKARLCIHPDKLQQRGATPVQKYIAEKVFSVLQNAWDAFISEEIFFS